MVMGLWLLVDNFIWEANGWCGSTLIVLIFFMQDIVCNTSKDGNVLLEILPALLISLSSLILSRARMLPPHETMQNVMVLSIVEW